jgi:HEAT repeat protein
LLGKPSTSCSWYGAYGSSTAVRFSSDLIRAFGPPVVSAMVEVYRKSGRPHAYSEEIEDLTLEAWPPITADHLAAPLSVDQAELFYAPMGVKEGTQDAAAGGLGEKWQALRKRMVEGDQLFEFWCPPVGMTGGRDGIALVRSGQIVTAITASRFHGTVGEQDLDKALTVLPRLLAGAEDEASNAAEQLQRIGAPAVPALCAVLQESPKVARLRALAILTRVGSDACGAVPVLASLVVGTDASLRNAAIEALTAIDRKVTLSVLIIGLRSEAEAVSRDAEEALIHFGEEAAPVLTEAVRDQRGVMQHRTAAVLTRLGLRAASAVPTLKVMLQSGEPGVRDAANLVLGSIQRAEEASRREQDAQAHENIAALKNPDEMVRRSACLALYEMGPAAAAAIPALRESLEDESPIVRRMASNALKKISATIR